VSNLWPVAGAAVNKSSPVQVFPLPAPEEVAAVARKTSFVAQLELVAAAVSNL